MPKDSSLQWDVFCRVIDNHGDLGVCLRLARHLNARGERVRLWVDDARALAWMANSAEERQWVHPWPEGCWQPPTPHQVVLETFGCHLPEAVESQLAHSPPRAWLNLEYLSAEPWVERAHGLPSPVMSGPAKGLIKRFCYPGFTQRTAGLLAGSTQPQVADDGNAGNWPRDLHPAPGLRQVSLFCYPHAPLAALFRRLAKRPTQVWVPGGTELQRAALAGWQALSPPHRNRLRLTPLPWLMQDEYDQLLHRCDLNVVRGEDSFVRAQWAGKPWLWHIYSQDDGSHQTKLDAFLDRWLANLAPEHLHQTAAWRRAWRAWNGLEDAEVLAEGQSDGLEEDGLPHGKRWREQLQRLPNLADTLYAWARENP